MFYGWCCITLIQHNLNAQDNGQLQLSGVMCVQVEGSVAHGRGMEDRTIRKMLGYILGMHPLPVARWIRNPLYLGWQDGRRILFHQYLLKISEGQVAFGEGRREISNEIMCIQS